MRLYCVVSFLWATFTACYLLEMGGYTRLRVLDTASPTCLTSLPLHFRARKFREDGEGTHTVDAPYCQ